MRKRILILSLVVGFAVALLAEWQPDLRLTNDARYDAVCNNNTWAVAADNAGTVHVVWYARVGSYYQIFYKKYSGSAWGIEKQLTSSSSDKKFPSIAVDAAGNVHIAWTDLRAIWYKRFSSGKWWPDEQVSASYSYGEVKPSIAIDPAGTIVVAYESHRSTIAQIFCRKKVGDIWQPETRVSANQTFNNFNPSMAIDSTGNLHVVWDGNLQVFYRKYAGSWQPQQQLTSGSDGFSSPAIACDLNNVHVVFTRSSNDIQYVKWSGSSWSAPVTISSGSKNSFPSIASEPAGDCHVVYPSGRTTPPQIWYCKNQDGTWLADTQLTTASGNRYLPTVGFGTPSIHVVWQDYRNGNPEIYYKRFLETLDAAVISIDEPTGTVGVNSTIQPKATVKNNGAATISFDVKCTIDSYTSTKTVTDLAKDATNQVIFDDWTPTTAGSYDMTVITMLTGDANSVNDTMAQKVTVVGIAENRTLRPSAYALSAARPNPVSSYTDIHYALPVHSQVKLACYDVTGKLVRILTADFEAAGYKTIRWDGRDNSGVLVPAGLYFVRLETPNYSATGKLVLTR